MLTRAKTLSLAWPVVLAQAATATTGVADTAVMGLYGDKVQLAAIAIAAVIYSFIYWGFGFLRMSTTGLAAQAEGRGETAESKTVMQRAILLGGGLGLLLLLLGPVLKPLAFMAFEAEPSVEALAGEYFDARLWGAPAFLMGLGVTGWLLGTGRTGALLAFQIVMNGVNVCLDWYFVAKLGWGPAGIGAGTAIAEWTALIFGLLIVYRAGAFRAAAKLIDREKLLALFTANRDIMIRTLALVFCFAWFIRSTTLIGTAETAGNEVLLQFITVSAFVLDAFAFVVEKEAGEAYGAGSRERLVRAIRLTSEFAIGSAILISALYFFGGGWVIETFIRDEEARAAALHYLPYCALVPLIGVAAFQLDGIFIGTTQGRALRNAGLAVAVVYVATDLLLRGSGNSGVWIAFLAMFVYRAIGLGLYLPTLIKELRPSHQ